jgi:hypothetical protein
MLMQLKGFVRLLSAAQENPLIAPAKNCKFCSTMRKVLQSVTTAQIYYKVQMVLALSLDNGPHWMEFTVEMLDCICNDNFLNSHF